MAEYPTPVLVIGERVFFGFRPAAIEVALADAGLWGPEDRGGAG